MALRLQLSVCFVLQARTATSSRHRQNPHASPVLQVPSLEFRAPLLQVLVISALSTHIHHLDELGLIARVDD